MQTLLLPTDRKSGICHCKCCTSWLLPTFSRSRKFWNVSISKTVWVSEKCSGMTFIEVDICHRIWVSAFYHTRALRHIRPSLTEEIANSVACSLVQSRLDYANALYVGMSSANFDALQRAQNTIARVVTLSLKMDHITPSLKRLHWLPVPVNGLRINSHARLQHQKIQGAGLFVLPSRRLYSCSISKINKHPETVRAEN